MAYVDSTGIVHDEPPLLKRLYIIIGLIFHSFMEPFLGTSSSIPHAGSVTSSPTNRPSQQNASSQSSSGGGSGASRRATRIQTFSSFGIFLYFCLSFYSNLFIDCQSSSYYG
jgi:hypothetical protein